MFATVSALTAARADDPAPKGDLAKLQGTWTAKVGPEKSIPISLTIKGTTVTLAFTTPEGDEVKSTGALKLDETAKPYKTIDWVKFTRPDGEDALDNLSIYEFVGDDLKLCSGGPGNERPTEFKAGEGGPPHLVVLKREGAKEKTGATDADTSPKGDLGKLQGKWTAKVGPEKNIPLVMTVKGNAVTLAFTGRDGAERELKGEIKLDDAAKPHKTLDWVKFTRLNGEEAPANLAIYELDGKTLKVCSGGPGNERPTEFKAGEGGPPNLIVLTKED